MLFYESDYVLVGVGGVGDEETRQKVGIRRGKVERRALRDY
jgi:hypothetical protein